VVGMVGVILALTGRIRPKESEKDTGEATAAR
jgi:hypothetical protein